MDTSLTQALGRRHALKTAALTAAVAAAFTTKVTGAHASSESAAMDLDILNFALNLEYLEAEFYNRAVFGVGLPSSVTGNSTSSVTGGSKVPFTDRQSMLFAKEIADDEYSHVVLLRAAITAGGGTPVNEPNIDLVQSFTTAALAAGVITSGTFDPFANETNFLLGAFIFEDVGVSAYAGAAGLITQKSYVTTAAQILAVEAYHAGEIRTRLYLGGYIIQANQIAAARAKLSGTGAGTGNPTDDVGITTNGQISIVDANPMGLAFTRTTAQVLSVVYLGQGMGGGGFFPNGVNGTINQA